MKEELLNFILHKDFPCFMAKAVARRGYLKVHETDSLLESTDLSHVLKNFYLFIDEYRMKPERLSSFIVGVKSHLSFESFEEMFWMFLKSMNEIDKKKYAHDQRVSADPNSPHFAYSVKGEAFFILLLHPDSPRYARRFSRPLIVFNPHLQFENLRKAGLFKKIRDLIRIKDKKLQGSENPMLNDFGEASEVFQYTGKVYTPDSLIPLYTGTTI